MIEPDFAFPYLQKQQFDIILAADRGLEFCYHYQIIPTYILGDFDSLSPEILNYYKENHVAPIREFNPMKDNTDTDIAFQQAIVLGSSEITILGATGGRLDHFLSIVQNLKTAWEKKIPAYIVDSRNLITIPVETSFEIRKEEQFGKYVSFFPLEKEVASITLEGFAYPLDHHCLPNTSGGLCVSNVLFMHKKSPCAIIYSCIGLFLCIKRTRTEKEAKNKNKGDIDYYEIRYRGPSERRKKYTFQFPDQSRSRERKLSVLYH